MLKKIGHKHQFSAGLVIGGKSLKEEQGRIDRMNILVATPGRLLQHMDQTIGFECDQLQVLGACVLVALLALTRRQCSTRQIGSSTWASPPLSTPSLRTCPSPARRSSSRRRRPSRSRTSPDSRSTTPSTSPCARALSASRARARAREPRRRRLRARRPRTWSSTTWSSSWTRSWTCSGASSRRISSPRRSCFSRRGSR